MATRNNTSRVSVKKVSKEAIPDSIRWLHRMVREGEFDYFNPETRVAAIYVKNYERGLFDPQLNDVNVVYFGFYPKGGE